MNFFRGAGIGAETNLPLATDNFIFVEDYEIVNPHTKDRVKIASEKEWGRVVSENGVEFKLFFIHRQNTEYLYFSLEEINMLLKNKLIVWKNVPT